MPKTDVLIIGAGPTGLVLALWLTRLGVRVRVVDAADQPGTTSRAVAVQARTLELYRQIGIAGAVVDQGVPLQAMNLWEAGEREGRVEFGAMGEGLSPYPYMLIYPQDAHEKLLIERLAAVDVRVERPVELIDVDCADTTRNLVTARLRRADGSVEVCDADYVAGCDGARSFVRAALRVAYAGGTYSHSFYVADVEASGPTMNGEAHVAFDNADFLAVFPLNRATHARLIGTVRDGAEARTVAPSWSDVRQSILDKVRLNVERVTWFSTYRVHHRVASAFRVGRVFLLGDAAHIHSPVGGQGMNTGIGDAINLAWKLAASLQGRADPRILDSYASERVPFAQRLVETTDRVFEVVSSTGPVANGVRSVAPKVLAALFHANPVRRFLFDTISQIQLNYRTSPLSEGRAGTVRGGDRLPWIAYDAGRDNFEPLASVNWQVHVYGGAATELRNACRALRIPAHVFPWDARAKKAGLARDGVYLVRPDGYIAMATAGPRAEDHLERYLDARGIRMNSDRSP